MKNLLILLTFISFSLSAQTIKKFPGVDIIITDSSAPPPDSVPPCQTCPAGKDGRGIQTTTVDPVTGEVTFIYTDQTQSKTGPLKGENGTCPNCPPSGGGTAVAKTYDVTIYGARGDGNTDDTQAFQRAFNDAAAGSGKVIIPSPSNFYNITNTISVRPPSGQGQVKVSVEAWGGPNRIRYTGASNKSVFYIVGIKNCIWTGFGIEIANGRSGVTAIDIDTESATISSSTGTKFDTYRINLGDGENNNGFRIGHNRAAVGNDISNILWMNGAIYGGGKASQTAYLNEGHNTLHLQWFETFTANIGKHYSNSGPAGRGNGGVNFFGSGGSGVDIAYDINFEQQYTIVGGTWELGKVFLKVPNFAQVSPNILVENVSIKNYSDSDGLIQVNVPANLTLQNVYMMQTDRGAYSKPVVVNSSSGVGSLVMINCTMSTNESMPYQKTGGSWRVTSFGNTRFNTSSGSVVTNKDFFPGEFDVPK